MKVAFIMLKSPHEQDPSQTVARLSASQDACAILFEDAVYHAVQDELAGKLRDVAREVLVAADDLEARGFSPSDLKVGSAASYEDIVDCIMERTERTVTV